MDEVEAQGTASPAAGDAARLLPADVEQQLRTQLPEVAERTVAALTAEVGEYSGALRGDMGATIERSVQLALAVFLRLAGRPADPPDAQATGGDDPLRAALDAAYALGRGEARSGRTMEALLAAYRVGARTAWEQWSATAVTAGLPAATIARFAALVFAYIDELSGASVAGHSDERAVSGRVRQQYLERLAAALLAGAPLDELVRRAERAEWAPPAQLLAVVLPAAQVRSALALLDPQALVASGDVLPGPAGRVAAEDVAVVLVPVTGPRSAVLAALRGRSAVVGPARPWVEVAASYRRAARTRALVGAVPGLVDTDAHLTDLVLTADEETLADLRARVLAPLAGLRPAVAERLVETLRSWLLHQGRRDAVAAELVVHPQTVRYRMGQLRELLGDRLSQPEGVRELTVALAGPPPTA